MIGFDAFQGCNSLRTVYVEDGCDVNVRGCVPYESNVLAVREKMIGDEILFALRYLKEVRFAEGIEILGSYWFCES